MLLGLLWWFSRKDVKNPMANANETDLVVFFKCLESLVLPRRRGDFDQTLRIAIQLANSHIKTESAIAIANAIVDFAAPENKKESTGNVIQFPSRKKSSSACGNCGSYQCEGCDFGGTK
jgi:hypothetical protein